MTPAAAATCGQLWLHSDAAGGLDHGKSTHAQETATVRGGMTLVRRQAWSAVRRRFERRCRCWGLRSPDEHDGQVPGSSARCQAAPGVGRTADEGPSPRARRRVPSRIRRYRSTTITWARTEENAVSPEAVQGWVAVIGGLLAAILGLFKYFNYRSNRDRLAEVGASFALTVEALASDNGTSRMAGAVLLRRFFDRHTEQGTRGKGYVMEAIEVMAGMLREEQPARVQKVLADGLRYARNLQDADLQNCDLRNAYVGKKAGDDWAVDLSRADLFAATCDSASFKAVVARETVFMEAQLRKTVFSGADCRNADFRRAILDGAKFEGAQIAGAKFEGAEGIPEQVAALLNERMEGRSGAIVPREPLAQ
jgi:hypothetical protein